MRITGDQDVRIDFTNPANQVVGLDLDGDGLIEFNGSERSISGRAANYEIVDAYSRNPLNHGDTANNFLGDIYFDGASFSGADGDGTEHRRQHLPRRPGHADTALGGVGNDFLAGGGIAQARIEGLDEDETATAMVTATRCTAAATPTSSSPSSRCSTKSTAAGPRRALRRRWQHSLTTQPAGTVQSDQDHDWLLLEGFGRRRAAAQVELTEGDGGGVDDQRRGLKCRARTGQYMDIEDVENLDASGNLYGFLDDMTDGDGQPAARRWPLLRQPLRRRRQRRHGHQLWPRFSSAQLERLRH
jgi:hypothetical protein